MHDPDMNIGILFIGILSSGSSLFLYSNYANKSTNFYIDLADLLYESNWTKLSAKMQINLIVIIRDAQKPIFYHMIHTRNLHLKTFLQVMNYLRSSTWIHLKPNVPLSNNCFFINNLMMISGLRNNTQVLYDV